MIDVLLLCTGNICRSPMAEAFLRDRLARRHVDAHVHSAGLMYDGEPATDHGVTVLRGLGLDISGHRSRIIGDELLNRADLVLGMARLHVREAVVRVPSIWPRTYTLKELIRRGVATGHRAPDQPLSEWLAACHAGRVPGDLLGDNREDDVADPYGTARSNYERTATELHSLIDTLVELAFPPRPGAAP